MKTNITLKVDAGLLREAKILAAEEGNVNQRHAVEPTRADGRRA
jgi:hypothetical protein